MSIVRVPFSLTGGGAAGYVPAGAIWLDGSADYLQWTPSGAGDSRTVYTRSIWFKQSKIGVERTLFFAGDTATTNDFERVYISSSDKLSYTLIISNVTKSSYASTLVLRDTSAWYHLVFSRSGATITMTLNGVAVTAWDTSTAPGAGDNGYFGHTTGVNRIGYAYPFGSPTGTPWSGYISEPVGIDGTAEAASSFGEYDTNNNWIPKDPSGLTFGTNGFWLNFADSADLGNDVSGNGNDWTPTSMSAANSTSDRPADNAANGIGNFVKLNPLRSSGTLTLTTANTVHTSASSEVSGTIAAKAGRYYAECTVVGAGARVGVKSTTGAIGTPNSESVYIDKAGGDVYVNGSLHASGAALNDNDVVGVDLDLDAGTVQIKVNDSNRGTAATLSPAPSASAWTFHSGQDSSGSTTLTWNFGDGGFTYTPPTGAVALCTANLPAPTVTDPSAYFQSVLYTGNGTVIGSGGNAITGIGFQPDFVWIKNRDAADNHMIFDAVRGVTKSISSNTGAAEATDTESLSTFDTDGFTVGNNVAVNTNTEKYVAWCLKAGGAGSANSDGSISSTVSVAAHGGFSIVTYTGTGATATVGHGMSVAPEMVWCTNLVDTTSMNTYQKDLTSGYVVYMNLTNGQTSDATSFNGAPSSTVINLGSSNATNGSTDGMVAYCFARIPGLIGIGSYVGNGSANGPYVVVDDGASGFRPAWLMTKRIDNIGEWWITDNIRDPYNVVHHALYANSSAAEETAVDTNTDYLANGFKPRNAGARRNASGGTYIYLAFAEYPFGGKGVAQAKAR